MTEARTLRSLVCLENDERREREEREREEREREATPLTGDYYISGADVVVAAAAVLMLLLLMLLCSMCCVDVGSCLLPWHYTAASCKRE